MAIDNKLQQFKTFNRRRRTQYSEETFRSGIKYATSPLDLGFARNLVNFDLGIDGNSLLPRPGLRTFEISQESDLSKAEAYNSKATYKEKQIYQASENIEEDGKTYRQALLGNVKVTEENKDKAIKTGALDLLTIYPTESNKAVVPFEKSKDIQVLAQHTETYDPDKYEFFFNSPKEASIHGVGLKDPSLIASHIGVELAAEGTKKYYCFRKNKLTGKTKPVFTTFDKALGHYKFEELIPQKTTAYNASLSMYNMLEENPYVFEDKYEAGQLHFMGVYITDLEGHQRQATYKNTEYFFRMNYAAAKGQKYKVIWEWKEPVASTWTTIETQYYDFTQDAPPKMQIKWAAPASAVIIRVQAFPYDTNRETVDLMTFSITAPATASEGQKYYNPEERKIFTYTGGKWTNPIYPLTSVAYRRIDDKKQLFRWAGNAMMPTDDYTYVSSQAILVNITFGEALSDSSQNLDYTKYDLSTCKGMTTWGQRLCIYAPDKGLNMLFLSEPNNPAWFPFPRNVSLFNENIIKCIPYLDYLLVFTTDAIYQLSTANKGDGWRETCLQKNLNIQMCDVPLIKIIKNMVFFKSNNYYYMVVPSRSAASGLSIAPISTNIELFLDNFEEAVEEMMFEVYDNKADYELICYKNHVNYKNIYTVYTFKSVKGAYFNLYLIYNIESRYWTTYCIESQTFIDSYKIDVADVNIYMEFAPIVVNGKISNGIQFLKYDDNRHDFYIRPYLSTADEVEKICLDKQIFKNYQYIDTGYREHESDFKKRFRELQFKLNNYAQLDLVFYTQFMIDGYVRQDESSYEIHQIVDPTDPRFGVISYDRVYNEEAGHFVPGATILGTTPLLPDSQGRPYIHNPEETVIDRLMWKLDISEFPETVFWKVRFPVSGKGYVPRLKILNMDQEKYEMLNISWIFRQLYSR